jgi:hypothetical protein
LIRAIAIPQSNPYAECLCTPDDILHLATSAKHLIGDELATLNLEFFLNSIARGPWSPRVLVVRREKTIIGLVYAKELKLAGVRTGLICADASQGPFMACEPDDREAVWNTALSYLLTLRSVLGIRLGIPSTEYDSYAGPAVIDPIGAVASHCEYSANAILALPPCYEELLGRMGKHTRRNFRYYRRQFETNGHAYIDTLTMPEFRSATLDLLGKSSIPGDRDRLEIEMNTCLSAGRPLLIGLRAQSGEWLAVLAGWYNRDQATVVFQMNRDQEHRSDSLSVVLRGYLIESLIERGFQSLVFVRGVSEPLNRLCSNIPTIILYLDKPNHFMRPARLLELAARLAPPSMARKAVWLARPRPNESLPIAPENPGMRGHGHSPTPSALVPDHVDIPEVALEEAAHSSSCHATHP